jgi:hypothetical protein
MHDVLLGIALSTAAEFFRRRRHALQRLEKSPLAEQATDLLIAAF